MDLCFFCIFQGLLHPYGSRLFPSLAKAKAVYKYWKAGLEIFVCLLFKMHVLDSWMNI